MSKALINKKLINKEIQLLDKRRADRLSGKSKTYTLEEAREIIKGKPKPIVP